MAGTTAAVNAGGRLEASAAAAPPEAPRPETLLTLLTRLLVPGKPLPVLGDPVTAVRAPYRAEAAAVAAVVVVPYEEGDGGTDARPPLVENAVGEGGASDSDWSSPPLVCTPSLGNKAAASSASNSLDDTLCGSNEVEVEGEGDWESAPCCCCALLKWK